MGSNTKRVAKNTLYMYFRMIFLMVISFYTSRALLATLGIEDYGIYSVVGSVAVSFSALKVLFSESIQRFLNIEKGRNNFKHQNVIFNMSLYIHFAISILFILVVECAGVWLLYNKLNIPADRIDAAFFVLQMTILSTAISIISVVYDAVIVSNERFGVYAAISIFDGIYRLAIIGLLPYVSFDSLKVYSAALVFLPIVMLVYQIIYCRHFEECKYRFLYNKSIFKEIFSLSGWNFFGNISFSLLHEGINMLLNIYGGLTFNASRAISYKVKHAVAQINHNTLVALRPRIMQKGATQDTNALMDNIITVSRISVFTMFIPVVPVIVYCDQLLSIWLKEVPESASTFTRLILVGIIIRSLHEPINMFYMTLARIKRMMLIEMFVMLSFLIIIYLSLVNGMTLEFVFVETAIMELIIILCLVLNAKNEVGVGLSSYLKSVLLVMLELIGIAAILGYACNEAYEPEGAISTIASAGFLAILLLIIVFLFLNNNERQIIKKIIKK